MYRFEKLRVYQDAMELLKEIYKITKQLPNEEKFALIDQLKRAAISIILNIAEGTGGLGDIEFKSYLRNSLKSLYETVAALKIAEKIYTIDASLALQKSDIVGKELNALIKSLTNNKRPMLKTND